jgi:hypothetical protein
MKSRRKNTLPQKPNARVSPLRPESVIGAPVPEKFRLKDATGDGDTLTPRPEHRSHRTYDEVGGDWEAAHAAAELLAVPLDSLQPSEDSVGAQREKFFRSRLDNKRPEAWTLHRWAQAAGGTTDWHTAKGFMTGRTKTSPEKRQRLMDALGMKVEDIPLDLRLPSEK